MSEMQSVDEVRQWLEFLPPPVANNFVLKLTLKNSGDIGIAQNKAKGRIALFRLLLDLRRLQFSNLSWTILVQPIEDLRAVAETFLSPSYNREAPRAIVNLCDILTMIEQGANGGAVFEQALRFIEQQAATRAHPGKSQVPPSETGAFERKLEEYRRTALRMVVHAANAFSAQYVAGFDTRRLIFDFPDVPLLRDRYLPQGKVELYDPIKVIADHGRDGADSIFGFSAARELHILNELSRNGFWLEKPELGMQEIKRLFEEAQKEKNMTAGEGELFAALTVAPTRAAAAHALLDQLDVSPAGIGHNKGPEELELIITSEERDAAIAVVDEFGNAAAEVVANGLIEGKRFRWEKNHTIARLIGKLRRIAIQMTEARFDGSAAETGTIASIAVVTGLLGHLGFIHETMTLWGAVMLSKGLAKL